MKIGDASMKAMPAPGWIPRRINRLATGTEPHSQTGNAKPAITAAGSWSAEGSLVIRPSALSETNTSIAAETNAPRRTNGSASTTIAVKMMANV